MIPPLSITCLRYCLAAVVLTTSLGCRHSDTIRPSVPRVPKIIRPHHTGMVFVPPGPFLMGSKEHGTLRSVRLGGFYIDLYEVTNEQYDAYCKATGAAPPLPEGSDVAGGAWFTPGEAKFPVANVTYDDAAAYAKWAGKRLPTEEEWERAARGTDGRTYPWGNDFDRTKCNVSGAGPAPVGQHPEDLSPAGCYDMAGNVTEWTSSIFSSPTEGDGGPRYQVVKGGAWDYRVASSKVFGRRRVLPGVRSKFVGFRCCKSE